MKREFVHQGDVQCITTDTIPSNVKKISKKPVALGELSGHQHVISGDYELFEDESGNMFAAVGSDGATLQHIHESNFVSFDKNVAMPIADHKPIELKSNTNYKIGIHRKYNPFAKIFEKVID